VSADGTTPWIGAAAAQLLLSSGAVRTRREGAFVLAAGWASPVYIDCRLLLDQPEHRRAVVRLALAAIDARWRAAPPFDALAGAETAGIPWAALLADQLGLPLRYVRKRPLGIGRTAQVEGGSVERMRVLLIDDLTTDGTSKVAFARGLRTAGAIVTDALVLFAHRGFPGADLRLAEHGLNHVALSDWRDVLAASVAARLAPEDRARIAEFCADPIAWSAANGGRLAL
jgi:orotate phosphoribosyltransferase